MLTEDPGHQGTYQTCGFKASLRFQASAETLTLRNQAINIDCFQICEWMDLAI